jgi:hypothetical protein
MGRPPSQSDDQRKRIALALAQQLAPYGNIEDTIAGRTGLTWRSCLSKSKFDYHARKPLFMTGSEPKFA